MPSKHTHLTIISTTEDNILTLKELCEVCGFESEVIVEFVEYGVVETTENLPQNWQFSLQQLERIKRARRLQHDLNVHVETVGLVLDLLDELNLLRVKIARFEHDENSSSN